VTVEAPPAARPGEDLAPVDIPSNPPGLIEPEEPTPDVLDTDVERSVDPTLTGVSTLFAVAGAGWMLAGIFSGVIARFVALLGALVGVAVVTLGYRSRRPALWQYLAPVAAVAVGFLLLLPNLSDGSVLSLISQAVRSGGVSHPPVLFDPGWRFLLFVLVALLGASATTLAVSLGKPKVGLALPAPLIVLGGLLQPPSATLLSCVVALVLFVAAFGVSFGVELAGEGASSHRFELRRTFQAAGVLLALTGVLVLLAESGFLLPQATSRAVVPPQFPQIPPNPPAGTLFTVRLPQPMPLRLGVLDVYSLSRGAWLTPPFDPARFERVSDQGPVPAGTAPGEAPAPVKPSSLSIPVTLGTLSGHLLPEVGTPARIRHSGFTVQYDPRTQQLRLPDQLGDHGLSYTELTQPIPTAAELEAAGAVPATMREYLQTPAVPPAVAAILAKAPKNPFLRLQYVRTFYYQHLVAAGSGKPVPMPPARLVQLLAGHPGSPFEIVAGEALLARWAGVPARMGFGYYNPSSDKKGSDLYSVTAADGAAWLEVYFNNYGWIPVVGTPPKARSSLDTHPKKHSPAVVPSSQLDEQVYVVVRLSTPQQLFTVIRYWVLRAVPGLIGLVLLLLLYPGLFKTARRWRRRRWAGEHGPRARIAVAYAEMRDAAYDLNIGDITMTPLEFADAVDEDSEHNELAWLFTRVFWGDLARDLRTEDADLAEDMSRSVQRRLTRAAAATNRIVAYGSRTSLRDPYSTELPNLWPRWSPVRRVAAVLVAGRKALAPRRLLRVVPRGVALLAAAVGIGGCGAATVLATGPAMPARLVPAAVGGATFVENVKAEQAYIEAGPGALQASGRVYSIRQDGVVQGDLQIAQFKPQYSAQLTSVKNGVMQTIAGSAFRPQRLADQLVYVAQLPIQQELLLLWFPPDGRYYDLLDAQASFSQAEQVFLSVLNYQQGGAAAANLGVPHLDPRQGTDYPEEVTHP
jgi:transglutaminase-like putative cysteine protease